MKNKQTICALLGTTHQEMAMLVGVSRGHWSMFQSGKRDLPVGAMEILVNLLEQVKQYEKQSKSSSLPEAKANHQQINYLLGENERKHYIAEKEKDAINRKQTAITNRNALDQCLRSNSVKGVMANARLQSTNRKNAKSLTTKDTKQLLKLEIKLELLQFEKKLLESKLRQVH